MKEIRMNFCIPYLIALLFFCIVLVGCTHEIEQPDVSADSHSSPQTETTDFFCETTIPATMEETSEPERTSFFSSVRDVGLYEVEGQEETYAFVYYDETYQAIYKPDNWKIIDSYQITNAVDIEMICEALAEVHPIHGADMESYRTAEDMAYEWIQHNLAYQLLSADSPWKQNAKDVDINPEDQGKSLYDLYKDRVGDATDSINP